MLCPSSRLQIIFGVGKPSARHVILIFWFSRTATDDGVLSMSNIFGGTIFFERKGKHKETYWKTYWEKQIIFFFLYFYALPVIENNIFIRGKWKSFINLLNFPLLLYSRLTKYISDAIRIQFRHNSVIKYVYDRLCWSCNIWQDICTYVQDNDEKKNRKQKEKKNQQNTRILPQTQHLTAATTTPMPHQDNEHT